MPCPCCGSTSPSELVSPGTWRCGAAEILPGYTAVVPPFAPGNPFASPVPVHNGPSARVCGTAYEPAPEELTDEQRAQEAALVESIRRRQERVAEWRRQVPGLLAAISDPTARLMAVVHNWGRSGLVLSGLYPESGLRNLDRSPPWDHDAVQQWFLASVMRAPTEQPVAEQTHSLLRRSKRKDSHALGWVFHEGSTLVEWFADERDRGPGTPGRELVQTIYVLRDGRRRSGGGGPARPGEGFNFKAVQEMAGMSRVESLPAAPPLTAREDLEDRHAREQTPSTYSTLKDIMEKRGLHVQKL